MRKLRKNSHDKKRDVGPKAIFRVPREETWREGRDIELTATQTRRLGELMSERKG